MRMLWRWPRERLIFTPAPSEVSSAGIIYFRARCVMVSSSRLAMVPLNRGDGQDENAEFWREGSKKLKERPVARPGHRQGRITPRFGSRKSPAFHGADGLRWTGLRPGPVRQHSRRIHSYPG